MEWERQDISLQSLKETRTCLTLHVDRWLGLSWGCYSTQLLEPDCLFIYGSILLKQNQNKLRGSNWPVWILGWTRDPFTLPLACNIWKHFIVWSIITWYMPKISPLLVFNHGYTWICAFLATFFCLHSSTNLVVKSVFYVLSDLSSSETCFPLTKGKFLKQF